MKITQKYRVVGHVGAGLSKIKGYVGELDGVGFTQARLRFNYCGQSIIRIVRWRNLEPVLTLDRTECEE